MSIFKILFKTAYYVVFLGIVTVTALLLLSLFPFENNYQVKVVLSGSMEPAIHVGSVVVIKSAPQYLVGDVVTFGKDTKQDIPVTHRIVERQEVGRSIAYVTQGDANESIDSGTVAKREVIGKVLFSVPYLGYVLDFVKRPVGFLTLVVAPALFIATIEFIKIGVELIRIVRQKRAGSIKMSISDTAPQTVEVTQSEASPVPPQPKKYI